MVKIYSGDYSHKPWEYPEEHGDRMEQSWALKDHRKTYRTIGDHAGQ